MWIALACPDLPVQVFTRGAAETQALAVADPTPPARIIAANAAAREAGITPGERISAARARLPELILRDRNPALEVATLSELAAWAGRFTPALCVVPPQALLLEVSASLRLFGGQQRLLQQLRSGLGELGIQAGIAAAPTPLAAHWLALTQPDTFLEAHTGWQSSLDALPLQVVRAGTTVSEASVELLNGVGIHTLGQARRLPREGLARRQGKALLDALARARGETPDPRPRHVPPEQYAAHIPLPVPTANIEPLIFVTSRLIAGLAAWLDSLQAACDRFELLLEHEGAAATRIEIVSGEPSRDAARLMLLAREHLSVVRLAEPVESLRIAADAPVARAGHTPDLFGDTGQVRENVTLLLDRLRARLGDAALFQPAPWPDHRPERAARNQPLNTKPANAPVCSAQRPTWLLDTPRPLSSLHGLRMVAGPERIETGWWDGADVRREYFVARTREDALWWVFRDLNANGDWYVHGYFG